MRVFLIIFVSFFSLFFNVFAQTFDEVTLRDQQASLYFRSIEGQLRDLNSLDLGGSSLAKEQTSISEDFRILVSGVKVWEKVAAVWDNDHSTLQAIVDSYNSRCVGELPRPIYDACMVEKPGIERRVQEMKARRNVLDSQRKDLLGWRKRLETAIQANETAGRAYLQKRVAIIERISDFQRRLIELQIRFDACINTNRGMNKERMHDVCGRFFDGNRVQDT